MVKRVCTRIIMAAPRISAARMTRMAEPTELTELTTRWGRELDPANVLPEYPRPQRRPPRRRFRRPKAND